MDTAEPKRMARVRVRTGLGDARRPITLIEVDGEHDYERRATLISALAATDGHLVVDLVRCSSIEKYVIGAILGKALDLAKRGHRLELVVRPSTALSRNVELLRLRTVVDVRDERPRIPPPGC